MSTLDHYRTRATYRWRGGRDNLIGAALLAVLALGGGAIALGLSSASHALILPALAAVVLVGPLLIAARDAVDLRRRRLTVALVFFEGLTLVLLLLALGRPMTEVLAAGLALLTAIPFLVAFARVEPIDWGEPIFFVSIQYLIAFALRALYAEANPEVMRLLGTAQYSDYFPLALAAAGVGFLAILVGYYSPLGKILARSLPPIRSNFSRQAFFTGTPILLLIGLAAWLYLFFSVGRIHTRIDAFSRSPAENLVLQLGQFSLYGLAIAGVVFFADLRRRRAGRLPFLLLALGSITYISLAYVVRTYLALAIVIVALAAHYCYRRLSTRWLVLSAAVIVLVVFPLIGTERDLAERGVLTSTYSTDAARKGGVAAMRELMKDGPTAYIERSIDHFMVRYHGVDSLATVLKNTPEIRGYQYGRDYLLAVPPLSLVPRGVWPEKPALGFSQEFGNKYFGRTDRLTPLTVYTLSELYMNFWWLGILIGAFLLGVVYRALHAYLIVRSQASEVAVFLYVLLLTQIVEVGLELSQPLSQLPKVLIFVIPIVLLMRQRPANRVEAA